jgi:hypothetical protein
VLGLGIDEEDEDEDVHIDVGDIPFIAEEDFLTKYGRKFDLTFNGNKEVVLTPRAA